MMQYLKEGDEIYIIAPSSCIDNENLFLDGIEIIKNWGLKVHHDNLPRRRFGYFSGDDMTRLEELEKSQNSKLIICSNGGWGASRLLEKNPNWKDSWLLGFSDTCSLLLSKYSQGSMGAIHGPMVSTLSLEPTWSLNRLRNLLFEGFVEDIKGYPLKSGTACGDIIVANLTITCFLIGTNHLPDFGGKIIIFEDINEDLYKIDRMFTYLRMSNKLKDAVGIGFGNFFNPKNSDQQISLNNLILESFKELGIPIISDLPIGHSPGNACIPFGFKGILNCNKGTLSVNINIS